MVIPVVFLGFAGLVKSLVKGKILWSNFYLGIDAALGALANGIINVADLGGSIGSGEYPKALVHKLYWNTILLVASVGVLLMVMVIHQRLEGPRPIDYDGRRWRRGLWLGVAANLLGGGSISLFIIGRLQGIL